MVDGVFNAEMAAAATANYLQKDSDAHAAEIEALFDEAEDRCDREMAEELARREAEKLKKAIYEELRSERLGKNGGA